MNIDELKKLGEAITQNAALLSALDFVESDPIEVESPPKSIERLKSAKIVDEVEEGRFCPGDNFDFLKKAIRSTNYAENIETDIQEWLVRFKQYIVNFNEATQLQDEDNIFLYKRRIYGLVRQINANLNNSIGQVEEEVHKEFGHLKTIEAKSRETGNYLASTGRTLERLGRLQYKELSLLAKNCEVEMIVLMLDKMLNQKREYLRSVIQKIQKLNLSFKRLEVRTIRLKRMHDAILNKKISLDVEQINIEYDAIFHQACSEVIGNPVGHFKAENTSSYEESVFKDIARRIRVNAEGAKPPKPNEDVFIQKDDVYSDAESEVFEAVFETVKSNFANSIINSEGFVSVTQYWSANPSVNEMVTLDAWLFEIYHWSKDLEKDLLGTNAAVTIIEEMTPISELSDIQVLSNLSISFNPALV